MRRRGTPFTLYGPGWRIFLYDKCESEYGTDATNKVTRMYKKTGVYVEQKIVPEFVVFRNGTKTFT